MPGTLDDAIKELRVLFKKQFDLQDEVDRLTDSDSYTGGMNILLLDEVAAKKRRIREYLETELLRYPPHHHRGHVDELREFHKAAPYEKSVFIMTKFPDGNDPADSSLKSVIEVVSEAISRAGMIPRVANHAYHDWLWQNVELYLLGCARGVAIVEDRYRQELNPNVALEWGWMRGMGKKVFFLMEQGFAHKRADWHGLLSKTFDWDSPKEGVDEAISAWLTGKEEV